MPSALSGSTLLFGDFKLDCGRFELRCSDRVLRLERKPMELLILLASREGQLVTRTEIADQLWSSDVFVDTEHGINTAIRKLRHLLHDNPDNPRFIQTVTGMGYRFIAPIATVDEVTPEAAEAPAPPAVAEPAEAPRLPADGKIGNRRLWLALTISCVVIAVILGLAIVPTLRVRYQTVRSWLGFRPAIQSVAVLPLVNLSNDPEQEYFSDGITEQLITDLSYAKPLRVLSRSSTIGFKGSHLSVPQIAEQLHVDALIEGTVLRANDTIRVTVRLTAAKPERQLWAASYERKVSDAITLQNELAADAVSQMRAQLTPAGRTQLNLESRINPEAYDEYLRGRFFIGQETGQKDKAIPHLERAIQLDPSFARAYAALGEAWALDGIYAGGAWGGKGRQEQYAKALEYSQKAVNLDPTSSEAYSSLGHSLIVNHRWNQGEVALRNAIELDPNSPYAAEYLALLLAQKGRNEESVQVSRELALANPVAIYCRRVYVMTLYEAHSYDEAIVESERLIELDPNHRATYITYATSLVQMGRFQEAEAAFRRSPLGTDPGVEAWLYVRQGNATAARKVLEENASSPINPFTAVAHYLLGEQERGLSELDYLANVAWANKTYFLRSDPVFDPMRNDSRFTVIVKKTGLLDN